MSVGFSLDSLSLLFFSFFLSFFFFFSVLFLIRVEESFSVLVEGLSVFIG